MKSTYQTWYLMLLLLTRCNKEEVAQQPPTNQHSWYYHWSPDNAQCAQSTHFSLVHLTQVARDSHRVPPFWIILAWARICDSLTNQWLLTSSEVRIIWIPIHATILSDSSCIDLIPRFSWSFLLVPRRVVSGFQGKKVQRMVLLATNDNET